LRIDRLPVIAVCAVVFALAPCAAALAQEAGQEAQQQDIGEQETSLAKQSQNPVGDLISLPLQVNTFFNLGENDRTLSILNIQPVIPFNVGPVNIVARLGMHQVPINA